MLSFHFIAASAALCLLLAMLGHASKEEETKSAIRTRRQNSITVKPIIPKPIHPKPWPYPCNEPVSYPTCGGRQYDPRTGFCCNEHWHYNRRSAQSKFAGVDACCGCMPFNTAQSTCCDGVLSPRNRSIASYGCCGKKIYSTITEMCCGNNVIKKGCNLRCCGTVVYNFYKQFCCQGVLHNRKRNHYCCGTSLYNRISERCCGDCIHKKLSGHTCCGKIYYNYNIYRCCRGKLFHKSIQVCCAGRILPKPYGVFTRCCIHYINGFPSVKIYDVTKSRCCYPQGMVVTSNTIIPSNMACCANFLYQTSSTKRCCGHLTYNPVTHKCCHGVLHQLTKYIECCGCKAYDNRKAVCCCNHQVLLIIPTKPSERYCCGGKLYDRNKGLCCGNRLYRKPPYNACCGPRPYRTSTHRCCNHVTGAVYYPRSQACCQGNVVNADRTLPGPYWACCRSGNTLYDNRSQVCCCDCVHRKKIHYRCCANRYYNSLSNQCCYDDVILKSANCT